MLFWCFWSVLLFEFAACVCVCMYNTLFKIGTWNSLWISVVTSMFMVLSMNHICLFHCSFTMMGAGWSPLSGMSDHYPLSALQQPGEGNSKSTYINNTKNSLRRVTCSLNKGQTQSKHFLCPLSGVDVQLSKASVTDLELQRSHIPPPMAVKARLCWWKPL